MSIKTTVQVLTSGGRSFDLDFDSLKAGKEWILGALHTYGAYQYVSLYRDNFRLAGFSRTKDGAWDTIAKKIVENKLKFTS